MGRRTHVVLAAAAPALLLVLLLRLHAAVAADPPFSCGAPSSAAFCDRRLPIEQRAADLVSKLTLEEKISQLGDESPAVDRLGVPAYKWWSEALHGVANAGRGVHLDGPLRAATSFPQVILTAASFNPHLWYRIGQVIGTEARGVYNNGQAEGLTFWAPNINVFRDPRWGRGQETPGEDPTMTGKYAAVFVRGVQGYGMSGAINSSDLEASACCKHFTAYDLENWKGVTRFAFDAKVTEQDLADTYNPPFKSCVEDGGASGIMCSYNRVNGVPTCADHNLLSKTARGDWSFNGYITSDCDAVAIIHDVQGYAKAPEDAVADVLKAGMDVNCGGYIQTHGVSAYQQGKITGEDIDRALRNLFAIRMRLGLFNGNPKYNRYGNIGAEQVCSKEHQDLALQVARDGIVLLKNDGAALPLSKSKVSSLAVIGPNGNNASLLLGNYFGPPCISVTPLQALQGYVKDARFVQGCNAAVCNVSNIGEAVHAAGSADYVVLFMGLDQNQEREEVDRLELGLPGMQESLVNSVADAAKKPVILVLLCGGPVDVTFAKNNPKIGAIVWAGYPGQAGGIAIAQVLFGDHNPGGRLPVTWYPKEFTAVPMTDMRMRADPSTGYPGRTYRFYKGKTVYNFGYGLSYSKYSHRFASKGTKPPSMSGIEGLKATARASAAGTVSYDVEEMGAEACDRLRFPAVVRVQNHGPMDGRHPVLLFLRWPNATDGRPASQLIGFQSVHLRADEAAHVEFEVSPCKHLSRAAEDGRKVIDQGSHFVRVGDDEFELSFMA
ncbi:probable beta-D-xylosidase 7 isoform X1 [Hordeum vulgare subsp. vulgare]|uniref:Fibronectin type III-like domain-containing protein n=1 Tax=Hordeum vulgare subsp. vulgare TaxID=112509 RepID=A0A8I6YXE3_HORVV|nr:probable beta-D-xylosidase 7 isoform X1 [Hordeum vulgare subsp. vulgare]